MKSYTVNVHDDGVVDYEAPNGQVENDEPDKVTAKLQLPGDLYDAVRAEVEFEVSVRAAEVASRCDYCSTYDSLAREVGLLDREQARAAQLERMGAPHEPRVGSVVRLGSVPRHRANGRVWERGRLGWRTTGGTGSSTWYDLIVDANAGNCREFEVLFEPDVNDITAGLRRFGHDDLNPARSERNLILKGLETGHYYYSDGDYDWSSRGDLEGARNRRDDRQSAYESWLSVCDTEGGCGFIEVPDSLTADEAGQLN